MPGWLYYAVQWISENNILYHDTFISAEDIPNNNKRK